MATGFVYHDAFIRHNTGSQHPERPARLLAILEAMKQCDFWSRLVHITPEPADLRWVLTAHSEAYVKRLQRACETGMPCLDTPDCAISADSFEIAMLAAGAGIAAVDAVMQGEVRRAFCAVRPPGHHAEYDAAMGFCLLNNVAIATNYLRSRHGIRRILIFDWDVHHGNGTQHCFENDGDVFFGSIHQDPRTIFPGTGYPGETGHGEGQGTTLNLPMPSGSDDAAYQKVLEERFLPAAEAFCPEFIFLSAGFDGHRDETLAAMGLSDEVFVWMGTMIRDLADRHCAGRLVSILEGGYNLQVLQRCVPRHVSILDQP